MPIWGSRSSWMCKLIFGTTCACWSCLPRLTNMPVAHLLGNAPIVQSAGQSYPVKTNYLPRPCEGSLEAEAARTVGRALREETGDILLFLPGQREIRKVQRLLSDSGLPAEVTLHTLFGEAAPDQQQAALDPARPGLRKVILSTSIAETSLTIEGVRIVIDAGLARSSRFDVRRGMAGLVTTPVSVAAADQRRGRAGRQSPGVCYRLWTETQHASLPRYATPEILSTDLAPLALDLARWGSGNGVGLRFIDPPPVASLAQARSILRTLGALDAAGALTSHGRAMAELPVHPRLAHMILRAKEMNLGPLACETAALLGERDIERTNAERDVDFTSRIAGLRVTGGEDQATRTRIQSETNRLRVLAGIREARLSVAHAGILLALAFPERIARRRSGDGGRYQMAGGTGAVVPAWSQLLRDEFLSVAEVDGIGNDAKIFLAAPVALEELISVFRDRIVGEEEVKWDEQTNAVVARRVERLDALVLREGSSARPHGPAVVAAMTEGIRSLGVESLPWDSGSESIRSRSEWLRREGFVQAEWPDLSEEHLLATLEGWLAPFLEGITRRSQLTRLEMTAVMRTMLTFVQLRELDRLAPESISVPSGSIVRLDYTAGRQPVLAVRLQEMFGQTDTPAIVGGKVPVLIHLLSPARRPVAVTQDLRSFWLNVYPEVRKEMRGRYPKHVWPTDPLAEKPTRRTTKRRGAR